jgi:hypothetical protein
MPTEQMDCRICGTGLSEVFADLGATPLCETFLEASQLAQMEPFFQLLTYVCENCFLVQLQEFVAPEEIFTEYAYFSSYSDSWLRHAEKYVEMATARFGLNEKSQVIELASNDGYLLQYFVRAGIPALGIEPAANVAEVAEKVGVPTEVRFFGVELAEELVERGKRPDLLLGNNVLAQVPDLRGFVEGMKILLAPEGVITLEFPHLLRLMQENQFDTIYHEHFSYFSLLTIDSFFASVGLKVFDVEELASHGGSLRVFARHEDCSAHPVTDAVARVLADEKRAGLDGLEAYAAFGEQVKETKRRLLEYLIRARDAGKSIAGYGAPGKGNTLLNYCGIGPDLLDFTVDRNPYKHGRFTPGTRIPIHPVEKLREAKPDIVLILPWNLADEITKQHAYISEWGGQFIVPIPRVQVVS